MKNKWEESLAALSVGQQFAYKVKDDARKDKIRRYAPLILLVIMTMIGAVSQKDFFTWGNVVNIMYQMSIPLVISVGLTYVLLLGMALGALAKRLKLPSLVGMLIAGMILGPYALNLLSDSLLNISADLRQLALIIILTRAGLSLDVEALNRVGRPAILMCFVPACFEILGMTLLAPALLGVSTLDCRHHGSRGGSGIPGSDRAPDDSV